MKTSLFLASFLFFSCASISAAFAIFQFVPLEGSYVQPGTNLDVDTEAVFAFRILKEHVPHSADNGTNATFRLWRMNTQTTSVEYLVGSDNNSVNMTKSANDNSIWMYNYTIPSNATVGNYYAVYGVTIDNQTYYSNIEVSVGVVSTGTGTGGSGGGGTGNSLTLNCAQHAAPSSIVYCVSTANFPGNGSYAAGQSVGYKVINESLETVQIGSTVEGVSGSYSFNFIPSISGNYIAYVNWTFNETNYSASDVVYAEIFKLTDEQNQTLYETEDRIEQLNSTLLSQNNFGGNNLTYMRTVLEDLRAYYYLIREEGTENAILVTDSINAVSSVAERYERGEISEEEAEKQVAQVLDEIKSIDDMRTFGRLQQSTVEMSSRNNSADSEKWHLFKRDDQTFIYYVKAIGILLLLLFGAYLFELDRKIKRFL